MKTQTTQEIIEEAECLKSGFNAQDFQLGISGTTEKRWKDKLNKIIRMIKHPVRGVELNFKRKDRVKSKGER